MRALVTGGAGFLGSHICRALLARGHRVIAFDNLSSGILANLGICISNPNFTYVVGDIADHPIINEAVDVIFHFASPASPDDYGARPIATLHAGSRGTENVLELARDNHALFFLASSSEVYGDPEIHPQPETYRGNVSTTGMRSSYGEAKRFAEALTAAYAHEYGLDIRIARFFNVYGPNMRLSDGRAIPALIGAALDSKPMVIFGNGLQTRSFCYVDDAVDGVFALLASDVTQPVNIGNPDEIPIRILAETIAEIMKSPSEIITMEKREHDPARRCPDVEIARSRLGWKASIDLREGLEQTIEWFTREADHSNELSNSAR